MRVKSFEMGSYKVRVVYAREVINSETGRPVLGLCNPLTSTLYVATHYQGEALSEDAIHHNFHHEKGHFKLMLQNEWKLNSNETFVDMQGGFDAQYEKTVKFQKGGKVPRK